MTALVLSAPRRPLAGLYPVSTRSLPGLRLVLSEDRSIPIPAPAGKRTATAPADVRGLSEGDKAGCDYRCHRALTASLSRHGQ